MGSVPVTDWIHLGGEALPVDEARAWVTDPGCGAVVVFCGTVRDHSDGRDGVTGLEYEAYEEQARKRMDAVADEVRQRHPGVARIALLHRVGVLDVSEVAVVIAVSAPHRDEAFEAARFAIDRVKESVPLWKRELWAGGSAWVEGCAVGGLA